MCTPVAEDSPAGGSRTLIPTRSSSVLQLRRRWYLSQRRPRCLLPGRFASYATENPPPRVTSTGSCPLEQTPQAMHSPDPLPLFLSHPLWQRALASVRGLIGVYPRLAAFMLPLDVDRPVVLSSCLCCPSLMSPSSGYLARYANNITDIR